MAIADRALTLEDFLALPEEAPALEFFKGKAEQKLAPEAAHSLLQPVIAGLFNRAAGSDDIGRAFTESRFSVAGFSLVPDVSFYLRERIPLSPTGRIQGYFASPPDIAVEILSPGQGVSQLIQKCLLMLELGSRVALLVHPADESILELRPNAAVRVLQGQDRLDLGDVLPGFALTVGELFAALAPRWASTTDPGEATEA